MIRVTDVASAPHPTKHQQGSPTITENDRKILLEILESDELETLFYRIMEEDFGFDALQTEDSVLICDIDTAQPRFQPPVQSEDDDSSNSD